MHRNQDDYDDGAGAGTSTKPLTGYQVYMQHITDEFNTLPPETKGDNFFKCISCKWKDEPAEVRQRYNEMAKHRTPPPTPNTADDNATPLPSSLTLDLKLHQDAGQMLVNFIPVIFDTPADFIDVKHSFVKGKVVIECSLKSKDEIITGLLARNDEQEIPQEKTEKTGKVDTADNLEQLKKELDDARAEAAAFKEAAAKAKTQLEEAKKIETTLRQMGGKFKEQSTEKTRELEESRKQLELKEAIVEAHLKAAVPAPPVERNEQVSHHPCLLPESNDV